jgi:hypothetical protein
MQGNQRHATTAAFIYKDFHVAHCGGGTDFFSDLRYLRWFR